MISATKEPHKTSTSRPLPFQTVDNAPDLKSEIREVSLEPATKPVSLSATDLSKLTPAI